MGQCIPTPRDVAARLRRIAEAPATPAIPLAGQVALDDAIARHPAGSGGTTGTSRQAPHLELVQRLDECAACEDLGAELCDSCAAAVLAAYGRERRQPR